ncbi:choline dehydrogenase-like flavoprotein [Sphingomonas sp. BE138]|uniref:GMC family oxidoreductase n=1 Tax=Sphingomonas sp. BE138 TaxID=2817845 RepID=UPI002866384E|nr:GMC family oxidoreductase [Sphingomonas sp. BE138]MDR6787131.1 choline dehydrogenase-like flavoprotein [Sphingomonas sp. BE138]
MSRAPYAENEQVDAVVVGTGAGGAPLLARLAEAGLSVVALDAGRAFRPEEHVADELAADIYWMEERLSGGADPTAFGSNNSGMGVGGSTLHWGAFCPRPDPRDLTLKSTTGFGTDWPIPHAELIEYVHRAEYFTGVSGPARYPWDTERHYAYPPVARNASADAMARGCAALGITATDAPAALVSRDREQPHWGQRQACVNCGTCHQGCRNAAKTSMDTSYLPHAVAHGAEIRAGARVLSVEFDSAGQITAVVYHQGGETRRQRCRTLFLCAGGVETPRLLLNLGIANSSGQVGRNFMAHVATQVWGTFDAEMRMNRGYPSSLITEDLLRPEDADFAGGYLIQSLGVLPVNLANGLARGAGFWGKRLQNLLRRYNRMAGIGINGDCLPHPDNRLSLSDETDAFGQRKARIDFGYHANERAIDRHARRTMTAIWEAAGARDIFAVDRSAHTIGTCRMGSNGDEAVVDADGRSFDIPNLLICDNSIFPSALAANPALTIMALSLRTADRFLRADAQEGRHRR